MPQKSPSNGTKPKRLLDVVHKVMKLQTVTRRFIRSAGEALGAAFWGDVEVSGLAAEESAYDEQKADGGLAFDASFFKSQYEFTFPEKAISVALRPPEDRSAEDVRFIRSMMAGILGFRRYSAHMQLMLARVVYYRRFGRGRVVVRRGHRGDSFYFVFSGVIAVTQDEDGRSALLDPEPILLHKGASFGEVALLKGLRRNATVVCMEDTEFLVVDRKEFFKNKLDQELQKELQYRFQFFRSLDLFSSWSDPLLETLADHCKTEQSHHSQVLVSDTSGTKNIFFVTKGRCEVLRLVDLSQCPSFLKWIKQHKVLLGKDAPGNPAEKFPPNTKTPRVPSHNAKDARSISLENLERGFPASHPDTSEPLDLRSNLAAAVYLRIDSIQPGQYFRGVDVDYIEFCLERENRASHESLTFTLTPDPRDSRSKVIVSQGAEIIRIKLDKFSELMDLCTLKKLRTETLSYPSDDDLCRVFLEQNRWKVFKSDLISSLSFASTSRPKHPPGHEKGEPGEIRPGADRRGILQLGGHKTPAEKISKTPETKGDNGPSSSTKTPIRLIHGIDIPKLCGKRVMW